MGLLRFLLALSVVIAHSESIFGIKMVGGQLAVQAFFMISGFYMTLILNEKYIGSNGSYKLFISNRLLRLYPIYWVVLILTILFSFYCFFTTGGHNFARLSSYKEYYQDMHPFSLIFLILTNVFLVFQDLVMFLGIDLNSGNLFFTSDFTKTNPPLWNFLLITQAWTIGIEIMFYLIAPFLVRRKVITILIIIFSSLLLRCYLYFGLNLQHDPWTYRFFPAELAFFLFGTIAYHVYKNYQNKNINEVLLKLIWIAVIIFTVFYSQLEFRFKEYLYLFVFFAALPFIFILSKKWKKDAVIGELSYPIYISHILVMMIMQKLSIFNTNIGIYVVVGTIVFSFVLNEFIAKRIEFIRQKRISK
ncbi:acyltransferase family protein [Chryseobacterium aquaticum]|uniref:Acyltransferase 3 domain-containing protein n=1 Tax=Chryseobacterium aquaticum subsp. greenlandense TaxID=345663 RepID=A0A117KBW9_9FLAO|nr:acyltransferase [Chryseobacterium aquaticum]KUJ56461.1 hypothetical protein AR686_07820 [Chryseobacterium aquaticum subsp. greenlandense]